MKLKTTNTAIKNGYYHIISIGYCDLQNLLRYRQAFAYNSGVCGWNTDFYDVNNVCISTGYRPLKDSNVKFDYDLVRQYENKARAINENYTMPYDDRMKLVNDLLIEFVNECTK